MPSWFPGARYKRYARHLRPRVVRAFTDPYDKVKGELVGIAGPISHTTSEMRSFRHLEYQLSLSPPI